MAVVVNGVTLRETRRDSVAVSFPRKHLLSHSRESVSESFPRKRESLLPVLQARQQLLIGDHAIAHKLVNRIAHPFGFVNGDIVTCMRKHL